MKKIALYIICIFCINSCKNNSADAAASAEIKSGEETSTNFFPVTTFIKGQIAEIKKNSANPLMITTTGRHTDSAWLKMEDLQTELAPFLQPLIDTANLTALFSEKKFLDQTLDAYTFTYDPLNILPDSMHLLHWDVYVSPADGKVTRIYMLKKPDPFTHQQLTWQSGKWGKIVTLKTTPAGSMVVEKEQIIIWNF